MECKFTVGQKVVCVDAEPQHVDLPETASMVGGMDGLQKGVIYTIRSVFLDPYYRVTTVRLEEIVRTPLARVNGVRYEGGFDPCRFRPVIDRKTDISVFTALLTDSKVEEPA